jgi:hypothetical protein
MVPERLRFEKRDLWPVHIQLHRVIPVVDEHLLGKAPGAGIISGSFQNPNGETRHSKSLSTR